MNILRVTRGIIIQSIILSNSIGDGNKMEDELTAGIDKDNYKPIRIKYEFLEDTIAAVKAKSNPDITDYVIKVTKQAMIDAFSQYQKLILVERLKHPLLVPRVCVNQSRQVLVTDEADVPHIGCVDGCNLAAHCYRDITKTPETNYKPVGTLFDFLPDHLDGCYDASGAQVQEDKFAKGSGVADADLLVYIGLQDRWFWNDNGTAKATGFLARATHCYSMPTARHRPVVGFVMAYVGEFRPLMNLTAGKASAYHQLVSVFMHELLHIFAFNDHLYSLFWKKTEASGNWQPWSPRSKQFPYFPLKIDQDSKLGFHEGIESRFGANTDLIERVEGSPNKLTYMFRGPNTVKLAARDLFMCPSLEALPMTQSTHLHTSLIHPEFMGPYGGVAYYPGFLSKLTGAFLEDSGWYEVNEAELLAPVAPAAENLGCNATEWFSKNCTEDQGQQRPFPFCQSRRLSFRCYTSIHHAKSTCDGPELPGDNCLYESLQPQFPAYKDLTKILAPMCQFPDLTPEYNIYWEKLDPERGTCFTCVRDGGCGAEWSRLDCEVYAKMSEAVKRYIRPDKHNIQSACYVIDCTPIPGKPDHYKVEAEKGEPQICRKDATFQFHDGNVTVGPFYCLPRANVCYAQRKVLSYPLPSK